MVNIWDIYNKSLKNIYYNEIIFMKMIMYYYTIIIKNKVNDQNYIKNNYNITEAKFELFNEYILKQIILCMYEYLMCVFGVWLWVFPGCNKAQVPDRRVILQNVVKNKQQKTKNRM